MMLTVSYLEPHKSVSLYLSSSPFGHHSRFNTKWLLKRRPVCRKYMNTVQKLSSISLISSRERVLCTCQNIFSDCLVCSIISIWDQKAQLCYFCLMPHLQKENSPRAMWPQTAQIYREERHYFVVAQLSYINSTKIMEIQVSIAE